MTMPAIARSKKVSLLMPVVEVWARVLHGIHTYVWVWARMYIAVGVCLVSRDPWIMSLKTWGSCSKDCGMVSGFGVVKGAVLGCS